MTGELHVWRHGRLVLNCPAIHDLAFLPDEDLELLASTAMAMTHREKKQK
jgi:hypothetical protein